MPKPKVLSLGLRKAKSQEYLSRKDEIITAYIESPSLYAAAKVLGIPQSSFKQQIKKWRDEIEAIRAKKVEIPADTQSQSQKENGLPELVARQLAELRQLIEGNFIRGEVVSVNQLNDRVDATVKFKMDNVVNVRLGAVEMRYI